METEMTVVMTTVWRAAWLVLMGFKQTCDCGIGKRGTDVLDGVMVLA